MARVGEGGWYLDVAASQSQRVRCVVRTDIMHVRPSFRLSVLFFFLICRSDIDKILQADVKHILCIL